MAQVAKKVHADVGGPTKVAMGAIRTDGGTQPRVELNEATVAEYAEAMREGAKFPPVAVFHDGSSYWLADGFHRFHALLRNEAKQAEVVVHRGDRRAAVLFSVGANAQHGLRRSNADKRRAVQTLLADPEWVDWSDRKIAEACGVSVTFVSAVRRPEVAKRQEENRTASAARGVAGLHPVPSRSQAEASHSAPVVAEPDPVPPVQLAGPAPVASSAPSPAPKPAAPPAAPAPDDGEPSLAELVDELQAENERLTAEIAAAEANDLKAEAIKWRRCYEQAVRQQSEAMAAARRAEKEWATAMRALMRCGKAVGVDDPRKIAAAVEAAMKQALAA